MNICFASLRKKVNYNDVLEYGMDVFYECFRYYKDNNPQHTFTYYNFAFGSKGAERNIDTIKQADVIIFPAVQEFIYFANAMHPRDVEKSQSEIRKTYEYLNNKDIILLTQDRGVDEKMVMTYTFENQVKPKSFQVIDEMDFKLGLHSLKYHYIQKQFRFPTDKNNDFVYWGSDKTRTAGGEKSKDDRLDVIKYINKSENISSIIIGRWPFKVKEKWIPMKDTLGYLDQSYTTLCFNWIDQTAVTGRYPEALACNIYPFVWKDYDTNNILVSDNFQRCFTKEELYDKIKYIKNTNMLDKVKSDFIDKLPSEQEYYQDFEKVINKCLK